MGVGRDDVGLGDTGFGITWLASPWFWSLVAGEDAGPAQRQTALTFSPPFCSVCTLKRQFDAHLLFYE